MYMYVLVCLALLGSARSGPENFSPRLCHENENFSRPCIVVNVHWLLLILLCPYALMPIFSTSLPFHRVFSPFFRVFSPFSCKFELRFVSEDDFRFVQTWLRFFWWFFLAELRYVFSSENWILFWVAFCFRVRNEFSSRVRIEFPSLLAAFLFCSFTWFHSEFPFILLRVLRCKSVVCAAFHLRIILLEHSLIGVDIAI